MSKVIKIGDKQYDRLKSMAQAHNLPMSKMFNILMNNIKSVEFTIKPEEANVEMVIDKGFKQMVEQYKTVGQVERENNGKLETD